MNHGLMCCLNKGLFRSVFRRVTFCSRAEVSELPATIDTSSQLARQIWKTAVRGARVPSIWAGYSKQVMANSPYLTPRDASVIMHSFARIKYKDERMVAGMLPIIIKHMGEFSVRELVSILNGLRKLEFTQKKVGACLNLMVNQLAINRSKWTAVDIPLIANAISWFRIFDKDIWKAIEKESVRSRAELSPLGISLIVGAMARLDLRNDQLLHALAARFMEGDMNVVDAKNNLMQQESLAVLINGFAKLRWDKPTGLVEYLVNEVYQLGGRQENGVYFFDNQSVCLILHAFFGYRDAELADVERKIFIQLSDQLIDSLNGNRWPKPSCDQIEKLNAVFAKITRAVEPDAGDILRNVGMLKRMLRGGSKGKENSAIVVDKSNARRSLPKLPRWEYEVFRILKQKMHANVKREVIDKSSRHVSLVLNTEENLSVVINCLGPFQYYVNSTKRTAASIMNQELIRIARPGVRFIEIPFYIWNELKTDNDKITYLMSLGREAASEAVSSKLV